MSTVSNTDITAVQWWSDAPGLNWNTQVEINKNPTVPCFNITLQHRVCGEYHLYKEQTFDSIIGLEHSGHNVPANSPQGQTMQNWETLQKSKNYTLDCTGFG